jgi:hypothetical protein
VWSIIAVFIFEVVMGFAKFFTRFLTVNVAIFALFSVSIGVALMSFVSYVGSQVDIVISQLGSFNFVAMYLPSNLMICLTLYTGVVMAGTIFNMTSNWLENKAYIFKA